MSRDARPFLVWVGGVVYSEVGMRRNTGVHVVLNNDHVQRAKALRVLEKMDFWSKGVLNY